MKIVVSHNQSRIKGLLSGLKNTKQFSRLSFRAIKRTMTGLQKLAISELKQKKALKLTNAKWKKDARLYYGGSASSNFADQYGKLWFVPVAQPLGRFYAKRVFRGIKQEPPFKGVRLYGVKVNKYGAPYLTDTKRTFIKMNKNGPVVFKRTGEARKPIEKVKGAGLTEILKETGVLPTLVTYARTRFEREFSDAVRFHSKRAIERALSKK